MGKYDPWGDKERQIQFTKPTEGNSTRRAVGYGRKKPAPRKQGPEELAAMKKLREMPKRIGKRSSSIDRDLREMPKMGMSKAQKADYQRSMLNDMRSRNILRARKKKGN
jgi:hypothetical protein